MIVRAWRTAKCKTIDEYETDHIDIQMDDPDEAKEIISNGWECMVNFTTKDDPYTVHCIPHNFVIEIREA